MGKKKRKEPVFESDAELLVELGTLDEVNAEIPTVMDHDQGVVPSWCELRLSINRDDEEPTHWPLRVDMPLRRHDGELIIQVLHDVLHPTAGGHAGDQIWEDLDRVVDKIQRRVGKGLNPRNVDVGQALGLATAIARLQTP
jgi:hypothetical protein